MAETSETSIAGEIVTRRRRNSVERAVGEEFAHVHEQIRTLFFRGMRSIDIAQSMNGSLECYEGNDVESKASFIRKLLLRITTAEERKRMNSKKHSERARRNHATQDKGRDEWMRGQGMEVWSDEERAYFNELIESPLYLKNEDRQTLRHVGIRHRRMHYNHAALAAAMNARFATIAFSQERTRRRLELIRKQEDERLLALETGERPDVDDV